MQESITGMNGQEVDGTKFTTKYKKGVKELNGVKVDSWEIAMEMDPNQEGAQMIQMMQGMIMGAGPMKGFYGAVGDGVVYTMAANEPLMAMAINNAKDGKGLGNNELVQQVRAELPENCAMEAYIGVKSVGDMALGFISMMAGPVEIEIPENLPPVGIGASMGESAMHMRVFIPSDVLKFAADMSKKMEEMQNDMINEMGGDEPAPGMDDEEGAPPKF
jgi:hypothetical protein